MRSCHVLLIIKNSSTYLDKILCISVDCTVSPYRKAHSIWLTSTRYDKRRYGLTSINTYAVSGILGGNTRWESSKVDQESHLSVWYVVHLISPILKCSLSYVRAALSNYLALKWNFIHGYINLSQRHFSIIASPQRRIILISILLWLVYVAFSQGQPFCCVNKCDW